MHNLMNRSLLLLVCILFAAIFCDAQRRSIVFKAEAGLSISVGEEEMREVRSSINPLGVGYIDNQHYKLPGFRVRIAAMKPLNSFISVGLRVGANVHYYEPNLYYGGKETYFSFPVQSIAELTLLHVNSSAFFLLLGAGHRFRKADYPPFHTRGGMLLSSELSFGKRDKESGLYYKIGFDYVKGTESFNYVPSTDYGENETLTWHTHRKQAFIAFGVNF
jgi:hypothetical protein